jgi:hypothetical protein
MPVKGWLGRAVGLLNPGPVGSLFILFFIILLAVMAPIAFRIGKLLVEPILWIYEFGNYSVGLSLTGSVTPPRLWPLHWLGHCVGVGVGLRRQ